MAVNHAACTRRVRCQINQPQTPAGVLVERVQSQVLSIWRKRELLKIEDRVDAVSHRAISRVPVELIKGRALCSAIDQRSVLRRSEFGGAEISR